MARTAPFEAHTRRYETWFSRHAVAYRSERAALERLVPDAGFALEVGVGTGRFAAPLGVRVGLDPSLAMLRHARTRGITPVCGIAEALPFRSEAFSLVLVVTTICFVDDVRAMLGEAHRVLEPEGALVIGFIDRDTPLGLHYLAHKETNVFYRDATFFSAAEVDGLLDLAGFGGRDWVQTLFRPLDEPREPEPPRPGYGAGAFVVVRAAKGTGGTAGRSAGT